MPDATPTPVRPLLTPAARPRRGRASLVLAGATVVLGATFVASLGRALAWYRGDWCVWVGNGAVGVSHLEGLSVMLGQGPSQGPWGVWKLEKYDARAAWGPEVGRGPDGGVAFVSAPLWIPVVLAGLGALACGRGARAPAGGCGTCGYPRAGLAPDAACPECGVRG